MADSIFLYTNKKRWKVDIESFEGPLDLLLHLIKKNNMDIYDIPISDITAKFIEYIELMKKMKLENVADFLEMASILMRIKSRTLLPEPETDDEEPEENVEEMKRALIERLIEYKKFKGAAYVFKEREKEYEGVFEIQQYPVKELGQTIDATLFDLLDAFQELIENAKDDVKDIITEEISVDDKIRFILAKLEKKSEWNISELLSEEYTIMEFIVLLLAILELARTRQLLIKQEKRFHEVYIEGKND
ncbi:segregation and condensation protein A [Elusimicrobiota bacterium]